MEIINCSHELNSRSLTCCSERHEQTISDPDGISAYKYCYLPDNKNYYIYGKHAFVSRELARDSVNG